MDKPLISFSVVCYNQEAFIREAVAGALSQTYSPLEIIISDDCSKDRTFDIVQEMAASYSGPHTIRLNRNKINLGIAGNCNQASALCQGELLVGSAGDDVSVPERTSIIVRAWNDSGRRSTSLGSRFEVIDENGRLVAGETEPGLHEETVRWAHVQGTIPGYLRRRKPHVAGCVHAISRKLISELGPLPETVIYEDTALCFRTVLSGGHFTFIDAPLVKYRRHGQNLTFGLHLARPQNAASFEDFRTKQGIEIDRFVEVYSAFAADAEIAMQKGLISLAEYPGVKKRVLKERRRFELKRELLVQSWFQRVGIFFQLFSGTIRPREMLEHLHYLLPITFYRSALITRNRMQRQAQKPKL